MELINVITLLIISFFAGVIGSLTGLGGASIITPILVGLGMPLKYSIANAMISVIATSSGSSAAYVRDRLTNPRAAMYLEVFTVLGGLIGAYITLITPAVYLYFFFALFLLTMLLFSQRVSLNESSQDSDDEDLDRFSRWLNIGGELYEPSKRSFIRYRMRRALVGGPMMMIAGVAAGSLGIGAGAFKTAIQETILGLPSRVASATSNFIVGMTGLAAVSVYIASGYVNPFIGGPLTLGTALGSILGSRMLPHISTKILRILSIAVVLYLITQMLYKGVTSLWI
ncbi:MAG: sulfite exporter TauE/SafE family protein [Sulfolobales archaeon]